LAVPELAFRVFEGDFMKNLIIGALLLALSCAPSIARAAVIGGAPPAVSASSSGRPIEPVSRTNLADQARDYAAREAANPALGAFEGGGAGIYIGGSALTVALIVVLIVIIL
jgi:hypothetical protein